MVVEEVGLRIADPVLHRDLQIDNALILRKHERLSKHLVLNIAAVSHFRLPQLLGVHQFGLLNRIRHPPGKTRAFVKAPKLAELEDCSHLTLWKDVDAATNPECEQSEDDGYNPPAPERGCWETWPATRRASISASASAAKELIEATVEVAPEFVKVWWRIRSPRSWGA
jgi:hypothetical protein